MGDERKYEHKTIQTVRGTDRVVISRMEKAGWELVDQTVGTVRTSLDFRRPKKRLPWSWVVAAAAGAVLLATVISVGAVLESHDGEPAPSKPPPVSSPTDKPSAAPSPNAGPAVVIECFTPDFEESIKFTIDRLHPDFSEAWSTPIPVNNEGGTQNCRDAQADESGDGPKLKPATPAEQAIWDRSKNSALGQSRSTLTIPYYQCVEHDSPAYRNTYPDTPNLAREAETMLLLCPDHPNAATIRQRIEVQNNFGEQIVNGETITDGTWRIGQEGRAGRYQTKTAGGSGLACYWARTAADGNTIASGVVSNDEDARTITVVIEPTDYEFYTENCGVWFRLD